MELIERYVYAIKRKLPLKNRDDMGQEIESLIIDELEGRFGKKEEYNPEEIIMIVKEMGSPRQVASRYRGDLPYLIGPELSETYKLILLIAAGAVTLGLMISFIIGSFDITKTLWELIKGFLLFFPSLISALLAMVGAVTITFAIIEKWTKISAKDLDMTSDWNPKDLPLPPKEEETVRLWEPIISLFFIFLALILLNSLAYGNLSERTLIGGMNFTFIQIINLEAIRYYAPLWNISFGLSIILQIILIITGKRDAKSRISEIIINLFDITILAIMIKGPLLISPEKIRMIWPEVSRGTLNTFLLSADRYFDLAFAILIILSAIGMISNTVKFILSRINRD